MCGRGNTQVQFELLRNWKVCFLCQFAALRSDTRRPILHRPEGQDMECGQGGGVSSECGCGEVQGSLGTFPNLCHGGKEEASHQRRAEQVHPREEGPSWQL